MTNIRWGLLSTARINRKVIPAIRESPRGDLVAVASRSQEKALEYAEKWNIPRAFGSYDEMLTSGEIDAVYIGLPNHLHAEWSIKSLQAGVHVLCEKPFTISLESVDRMIAASQESGCVIAEAFMYRHHPQTKLIGQMIYEGKLGEISLIRGTFNFKLGEAGRKPESLNVRMIPEYGGGCLWDVGIYPLSYAQFLLGSIPDWVFGSQVLGPTGIDEVFAGQMGYQKAGGNEVLVQISSSFNTPFHTFIEVIGSEGKLYITRPFNDIDRNAQILFSDQDGKTHKIRTPKKSLYLGEVEDIQNAILNRTDPLISLEESKNHVRTALALYKSAQTGKVVNL
jgi:xylose dehydrogenase (NAD/NADP)